MPTIERMMDAAIVGMVVLDLVLTGMVFSHGAHPPRASLPQRVPPATKSTLAVNKPSISWDSATPTTSLTTSEALFILLRALDICGAQPYVSPSANAQKWDYGGGTNTAQNWVNWGDASMPRGFRLSTSLANSAAASDLPSSKPCPACSL